MNHDRNPPAPQAEETLPHNIEAEQQLLGALMNDASRIDMLGGIVEDAHFFDPVHAAIFDRIRTRWKQGRPSGPSALSDWAKQHEGMQVLGGHVYLAKLAGGSIAGFDFKGYAGIVRGLAEKRELILQLEESRKALDDDDATAADVGGRLEAFLMTAQATQVSRKPVSMMKAATTSLERVVAAQEGQPTGSLPSGIRALDRLIGGFNPGMLYIIAGRPSMGKSALAVSISTRFAKAGNGVVINSREMMADALADRVISERTSEIGNGSAVPYTNFPKGGMAEHQYRAVAQAVKDVSTLPIFILDDGYADVGSTMAGARHCRTLFGPQVGLKAIVIDYMQLMKARTKEGRRLEVGEVSRDLKEMAKRLEVPVIALSQLSRAVESREDKRPLLSDLRESGDIEQDADAVLFCYRHAYYLEREKAAYTEKGKLMEWQEMMDDVGNRLEIIVAKQRQGPIGTAHVKANLALNAIWED